METTILILMITLLILSFCTNMIGICLVWSRARKNNKESKIKKLNKKVEYLENLKTTTADPTAQALINIQIDEAKKKLPKALKKEMQ